MFRFQNPDFKWGPPTVDVVIRLFDDVGGPFEIANPEILAKTRNQLYWQERLSAMAPTSRPLARAGRRPLLAAPMGRFDLSARGY